jgi:hypothetical protein
LCREHKPQPVIAEVGGEAGPRRIRPAWFRFTLRHPFAARHNIIARDHARAPGNFAATTSFCLRCYGRSAHAGGNPMHGLIYLIGLVVVILAILSFFGLR